MFKIVEKMSKKEYLNMLSEILYDNYNMNIDEHFNICENQFIETLCFIHEIKQNETSAELAYFNHEDLLFRFNKFIEDSGFEEKISIINNDPNLDVNFDIRELQPIEFFNKNGYFLQQLSTYELTILNLAFISKKDEISLDFVLPPEKLPDKYKNRLLCGFNSNIFLSPINEFPVNQIQFYPLEKEPEIRTDLKPYIWIVDFLMIYSKLNLNKYQNHKSYFIYVYINLINSLKYNEMQLTCIINEYKNFLNYFFDGLDKISPDKKERKKTMLKEKISSHKLAVNNLSDNEMLYKIIEEE